MSHFVDPSARKRVDLGDGDWVDIRAELTPSDIRQFTLATDADDAGVAAILAPFVLEWNLRGPDGASVPVSPEAILVLKLASLKTVVNGLGEVVKAASTVPNPSGAPSPESSRGSASPTPNQIPTPTT